MTEKTNIHIVWNFDPLSASNKILDGYTINPFATETRYMSDENFSALEYQIKSTESDLIVFLGYNQMRYEQIDALRLLTNRKENKHIFEFGGGNGAVYKHFIDQETRALKDAINDDTIEDAIKECFEEYDLLPKFIELKETLSKKRESGIPFNKAFIDDSNSSRYENAFDFIANKAIIMDETTPENMNYDMCFEYIDEMQKQLGPL